jgi:fatty acid amide hydrolase
MSKNFTLASSSAIFWNIHQFPGGVVPVTRVRADETVRKPSRDLVERHAAKVDAQSEGLPVGVQVVGRPWAEATVLAVMEAIEASAKGDPSYPHTPVTPR